MSSASAPRVAVGDVGGMSDDHRLLIPVSVRQSLEWLPDKGAQPFALIADLRDSGWVRLYPFGLAQVRLETLRQQLLSSHSDPPRAIAALADRYRELTYYPSDTRVHCGAAIGWYLKSASQHIRQFYVEGLGDFINVMTLERRNARLHDLMEDLELPDD
jgi:hypothetical protein